MATACTGTRDNPFDPLSENYEPAQSVSKGEPGLIVDPAGGLISLSLATKPTADVILDPTAITVSTGGATYNECASLDFTLPETAIVFTPQNYDQADEHQLQVAYPDNDCVHYGLFLRLELPALSSKDKAYDGLVPEVVSVTVTEDSNDLTPVASPVTPYTNQTNFSLSSTYAQIVFSRPMDLDTITNETFQILDSDGKDIGNHIWHDTENYYSYISFGENLRPGEDYIVHLAGSIKDFYGNPLNGGVDHDFTFQTELHQLREVTLFNDLAGGLFYSGIASSGNTAFLVNGSRLKAFDISTPDSPTELDNVLMNGRHLFLNGTVLYSTGWEYENTVKIIDVSTPSSLGSPTEITLSGGIQGADFDSVNNRFVALPGHLTSRHRGKPSPWKGTTPLCCAKRGLTLFTFLF